MRQCLIQYSFILSKQNPYNIRDIVGILCLFIILGVVLWTAPWIGYHAIECNYERNTSMDCMCRLHYSYTNCFVPGVLVMLLIFLTIVFILLVIYVGRRFYRETLPIWRDHIEASIKPISFIIAARGQGESQHLINAIPPPIYNQKWTQLKFMVSDDNPDSLISRQQKDALFFTVIVLLIAIILVMVAPFIASFFIETSCTTYDDSWVCVRTHDICRNTNITTTRNRYYNSDCLLTGVLLECAIAIGGIGIAMIILGIINSYNRCRDSVRDLPEIIALQGNSVCVNNFGVYVLMLN